MYFAGLNLTPQLSHTQGLEAVVWAATTGGLAYRLYKIRATNKLVVTNHKRALIPVAAKVATAFHAASASLPVVGYIFATAYNGLEQPEWLRRRPIPIELSTRDNFIVRTVAAVAFIGFSRLSGSCLDHLGSQFAAIGVSDHH